MALIIAAVLIVVGIVGAVAVAIAVPVVLGLMAHDVLTSPKPVTPAVAGRTPEQAEDRIFLERSVARGFVILGGVFWGVAVFAGLYSFRESGVAWSMLGAFVPFVATLATLIVGWYYERVTAIMLVIASAAVVYWGVMSQFEAGVWIIVTIALIGPMATAAVLFWMARREQEALDLQLSARVLAGAEVTNR